MRKCILATAQLNQWVLDYDGNRERIVKAIEQAKHNNSSLILTPELCIPGYGLLDHWLENDVYANSWDNAALIISDPRCQDIIIDLGLPIQHHGCSFNARLIALNGQILAIRPKLDLCNDGNFREMRYFSPWPRGLVEDYSLPDVIRALPAGQQQCRIGEVYFQALDGSFVSETCEELWTPNSPHIKYSLAGIEIVLNSSGSHHELRKLNTRVDLIKEATKTGGVYMYSNQRGCDGDRLYYDGCAMIMSNGSMLAQGSQFSLRDVEVQTAVVDLDEIWSWRTSRSRGMQAVANSKDKPECIYVDYRLCRALSPRLPVSEHIEPRYHLPEEEIALGPACWLWDYLRRSKTAGYLVPLSGGIDSCATATIVYSMCRMVISGIEDGDKDVIADVKRLCSTEHVSGLTTKQLCNKIFTTVYMGMKKQSSAETRNRAADLAREIGAHHVDTNIDPMFNSLFEVVSGILKYEPRFKTDGGKDNENLALQNFQSRSRMVLAYGLAQLIPTSRGQTGNLLVLGSANVDECLRGYLTKYDCSSADINPIGGISKSDLKRFIKWATTNFDLPILDDFLTAVPTAELEPITDSYVQSDEIDMGFTYDELSILGRLRKTYKLGMVGMFESLVAEWTHKTPREVYQKVADFMKFYAINRHKMTTMTPGLYLESYTPDDNRYDLRPFLYPVWFPFERRKIENLLETMEEGRAG